MFGNLNVSFRVFSIFGMILDRKEKCQYHHPCRWLEVDTPLFLPDGMGNCQMKTHLTITLRWERQRKTTQLYSLVESWMVKVKPIIQSYWRRTTIRVLNIKNRKWMRIEKLNMRNLFAAGILANVALKWKISKLYNSQDQENVQQAVKCSLIQVTMEQLIDMVLLS